MFFILLVYIFFLKGKGGKDYFWYNFFFYDTATVTPHDNKRILYLLKNK